MEISVPLISWRVVVLNFVEQANVLGRLEQPVQDVCEIQYYPGMQVGQAFQPDRNDKSGWKA